MPGLSGLQLAERVAELHPAIPVILTTGHLHGQAGELNSANIRKVLTKPYDANVLIHVLHQVLREMASRPGVAA